MAALIVLAGGVDEVDENVALDSLESTGDALDITNERLTNFGEGLKKRIEDWAESEDGSNFSKWQTDQFPLSFDTFDSEGATTPLEARDGIEATSTLACVGSPSGIDCESDADGRQPDAWARQLVERRAELVAENGPIVVHGFVVDAADGQQVLVRYEADPLVSTDSDISSGIADLALIALPLLLLGLGAITWFSLGRALGPVAAMIDQVDNIGADSLDQRIEVPAADDELKHLATTMNQMLDRLQGSNERQRQFISDASHELRSPITATSATLEVARARPDEADWEQVAAIVDEENTRLARLVDDLLLLARMDEDAVTSSPDHTAEVDLDEICLAEADRPHPVEVSVRVIEPARVVGNVSTLTRAIRNLVENGAAHATTSVWIEVDQQGEEAVVRVSDDGPGVAPEYAEKIFERFVRVDESRARNGSNSQTNGGAGLGLAIARRVAQNHQGRLELTQHQGIGATFELALPSSG